MLHVDALVEQHRAAEALAADVMHRAAQGEGSDVVPGATELVQRVMFNVLLSADEQTGEQTVVIESPP
jgi:hypothetical protein